MPVCVCVCVVSINKLLKCSRRGHFGWPDARAHTGAHMTSRGLRGPMDLGRADLLPRRGMSDSIMCYPGVTLAESHLMPLPCSSYLCSLRSTRLCPAELRAGVLLRASAAARPCAFPCPPVLRGSCFCPLTPSYHQPPRPMAGKPGPARQAALWHKAGMPVLRSGGCSWFVYGTSSGYP